jgi:hypothetical protein
MDPPTVSHDLDNHINSDFEALTVLVYTSKPRWTLVQLTELSCTRRRGIQIATKRSEITDNEE